MKTRTRVLQITGRADSGGGPEHVYQVLSHTRDAVDAWVACPAEDPYWGRYKELLGPSRVVEIPRRRADVSTMRLLVNHVRLNDIDLLHSHGKAAGAVSRPVALLTRKPVIHTFHGVHLGDYGALARAAYPFAERALSAMTDVVVAVSSSERNEMIRHRLVNRSEIVTIENGVCVDVKTRVRQTYPSLRVVNVTRNNAQKDPHLLAQVIRLLEESGMPVQVFIVCPASDKRAITTMLEERSIAKVIGPVEDAAKFIGTCDVLLSTSAWEGMPLVLLEALARGVPAVVTAVPGNIDVAERSGGVGSYDRNDPSSAVSKLAVLCDASKWTEASAEARASALEHWSINKMIDRLLEQYEALGSAID